MPGTQSALTANQRVDAPPLAAAVPLNEVNQMVAQTMKAPMSPAPYFFPVLDNLENEIDSVGVDDSDESNSDKGIFEDGEGIGMEDEDKDDLDDEDSADGNEEGCRPSKNTPLLQGCFVCPMLPWLKEPFKQLLLKSSNRDRKGLPPLYSVHSIKPSSFQNH